MIKRQHRVWTFLTPRLLPFADAATPELPLGRLLRLSLFQVSVGMAIVLLNGTLNRVMVVELGVATWLVAVMVALPLVFAPLRALVGFRSDNHRSVLGWRRVPYIWFGTLIQFGGFEIAMMAGALLGAARASVPVIVDGFIGSAAALLAIRLAPNARDYCIFAHASAEAGHRRLVDQGSRGHGHFAV